MTSPLIGQFTRGLNINKKKLRQKWTEGSIKKSTGKRIVILRAGFKRPFKKLLMSSIKFYCGKKNVRLSR
jgi:hypothetical protein